jgi:hypothetical protein
MFPVMIGMVLWKATGREARYAALMEREFTGDNITGVERWPR